MQAKNEVLGWAKLKRLLFSENSESFLCCYALQNSRKEIVLAEVCDYKHPYFIGVALDVDL
jgi:hypothetical protein